MNKIRITAIILSLVMIFSLTSCRGDNNIEPSAENPTTDKTAKEYTAVSDETSSKAATSAVSFSADSSVVAAEETTSPEAVTVSSFGNPDEWSKEQIIEVYKNAAKKTNTAVKSVQSIELKSISINNGEHEGVMDFITSIMSKFLANNSTEKDGITGGYGNLSASDAASAKAYKIGNCIAIEMVMHEQVSGARDDALSGSVGHAITAVGDISVVTDQLKDMGLPLEISEKNTTIHYTNPRVRVLINDKGEIVNGTWSYTVEIRLNNYKAFGKDVDTTSVIMDNVITVNGGFKK
ncbi:MAG: hypothetical protein IJZ07_08650 [Clostridia bacterium]|nr:hypothetical protein [Clostridia bacterium]